MRILYCNKYDYPFSGTETYLFELIRHVADRGHRTALFSMDHGQPTKFDGPSYRIPRVDFKESSAGAWKKARLAAHAIYSLSAQRAMRACLDDYAPDLAHVRSVYHHLSPSVLWELRRHNVPVLYHLNDFKILCPTYNFVADGGPCEACKGGAFFHAVSEGCYHGSHVRAAVLAAEAYLHRWLQTYQRCVDLFLAPSEFVRERLLAHGFPSRRIAVLSHFQSIPDENRLQPDEGYVLYFGRLSPEKGVHDLLRAMVRLPHIPLVVAGDGSERTRLESLAHELNLRNVLFAGEVHGASLVHLIAGCSFSVFPSRAYETLGKSILESYAWARPVVASDLGSRRELVDNGVTGLLYPPGNLNELANCIAFLFDRHDLARQMGSIARHRLQQRHDPHQHLDALLEIYSRLMSRTKISVFPRAPRSSENKPVRVAFIGGRGVVSKYSGIESYYEQAGSELVRLGHEVSVYCRSYFTPKMSEYLGMHVLRLPTVRSKHLETAIHTFLSTVHAMLSDIDIVHYHCLGPALFSFLPRLAGKKTVVTAQGLDWHRRKWGRIASRVLRWGEYAAIKFSNATMVVSHTLQQYFQQHYRRHTIYVPNGASSVKQSAPTKLSQWGLLPDHYVLFLGRFSPEKNCHLLIEAFEHLRTEMKLVLAGGSSHSDGYIKNLRRRQSDRVLFLPWMSGDDLAQLLSNAALFVLPSDLEGLSLALLDAMAAGVCVLASDIPENKEVVSGAGYTFRRGDRADLERMLDMLVRNPGLRRQAARRAKQRVQAEYSWPAIARLIEKGYYEVLCRAPSATVAQARDREFESETILSPPPSTVAQPDAILTRGRYGTGR
jgi:glycosyltransferase involved in cell wall biosynthesis